jgi:hypothetical protein
MKSAAACLLVALALWGASAMAPAAGDPMDRLRTCSTLSHAERMKCLDLFSREIGPESARPRSASGSEGTATPENWVVSETTSPIDYSPVVIATATARGAPDDSGMKLSIACRGGTTSLVLGGPSAALPVGDRYAVSYAVDGGSPTTVVATAAPSGTGMAIGGDVVHLLVSLPPQGEIAFRIVIVGHQDVTLEGRYSLAGLKTTRERMAFSCGWPRKSDTLRK